ncbi:hypothetical protein JCM1841_003400 [Sporobolomyces salmonicolor]
MNSNGPYYQYPGYPSCTAPTDLSYAPQPYPRSITYGPPAQQPASFYPSPFPTPQPYLHTGTSNCTYPEHSQYQHSAPLPQSAPRRDHASSLGSTSPYASALQHPVRPSSSSSVGVARSPPLPPSLAVPAPAPTIASSIGFSRYSNNNSPSSISTAFFGSSHPAREHSPPTSDQLLDRQRILTESPTMSGNDYNEALRDLSYMTVDRLKYTIRQFNDRLGMGLRLSGLKNELYNRLKDEVVRLYTYDPAKFQQARRIISTVRTAVHLTSPSSTASSTASTYHSAPSYSYGGSASTSGRGTTTPAVGGAYGGYSGAYGAQPGSTSVSGALPPPRFGAFNGAASASTSAGGGAASGAAASGSASWQNQRVEDLPIKFRPSPFYYIHKTLTPAVTLAKAAQGDRKVASLEFALTEAQRNLLTRARESPSNPQYEVRLYCTSDANYNAGRVTASQFPAPIEFPATCEVKLNGQPVQANTKGIKKQPGTAPPVNLSSKKGVSVSTSPGSINKVDVIYVNTEKLYYLVAYFVEKTSVAKVVEKVKANKKKSKEEVIKSIVDLNSDDDVAAGSLGMSLKDPLSFCRIAVPIRSSLCNHVSCFDAETWFEMNEQTPTWQCPICSKTLKVEDIVVDGYFEDILNSCPSNVEAVTVEPDGSWRSDDNKHGTAPPRAPTVANSAANSNRGTPALGGGGSRVKREHSVGAEANDKGKGRATEESQAQAMTVLSSDDDDDDAAPLAKRPRLGGPGFANGTDYSASASPFVAGRGGGSSGGAHTGGTASRHASEVLDLTLSDSDDDAAPPPAPPRSVAGLSAAMNHRQDSGGERKTVADVEADINAMHRKMSDQWGENWRERFGV